MSRFQFTLVALGLVAVCYASPVRAQVCCVKGNTNDRLEFDFDGNGIVDQTVYDFRVNGEDIHNFIRTYLFPGSVSEQADCASDMDDNGTINEIDLALFVDKLLDPTGLMCDYVQNCLGGGTLVYEPAHPDENATKIAYDNTGIDVNADPFELGKTQFFVPNTIIDRIARDFDDIVALSGDFDGDLVPDLTGKGPNQTLFAHNNLIVRLNDPLGLNPDYECLNAFFGVDSSVDCAPPCSCNGCCIPDPMDPPTCTSGCVRCIFGCNLDNFKPGDLHLKVLYLPTEGFINIPLVSALYAGAVQDIRYAEPDGCIGGVNAERNIWRITNGGFGFWDWEIEHGFQDCFDGCDCLVIYDAFTEETGEQPVVFLPPVTLEALPGTCTFFATPTGACCVDFLGDGSIVECFEQEMNACFEDNAGAAIVSYLGNGTTCTPDPCGPRGACCVGTSCQANLTQAECDAQFGTYLGDGVACDPIVCDEFGACCHPTMPGVCVDSTLTDCINNSGLFQGDGTTCATPGICG